MQLSKRLIGNVIGRDIQGNCKVRCEEWPRIVILCGSLGRNYVNRDVINLTVNRKGRNFDFSDIYGKPSERIIDLILVDNKTGDALILGEWEKELNVTGYQATLGGLQAVFSHQLCKDESHLKNLLALINASPNVVFTGTYTTDKLPSLLGAAIMPRTNPDRQDLETTVSHYLYHG